jgi:hypothetical protein
VFTDIVCLLLGFAVGWCGWAGLMLFLVASGPAKDDWRYPVVSLLMMFSGIGLVLYVLVGS